MDGRRTVEKRFPSKIEFGEATTKRCCYDEKYELFCSKSIFKLDRARTLARTHKHIDRHMQCAVKSRSNQLCSPILQQTAAVKIDEFHLDKYGF